MGGRWNAARAAVVVTAVVVFSLAGGFSGAVAAEPGLDVAISSAPTGDVTAGQSVRYAIRVANPGRNTWNHVVVFGSAAARDATAAPAISAASTTRGTCSTSASASVTCDIGSLRRGQEALVTVLVRAPNSGSAVTFVGDVRGDEVRNPNDPAKPHVYPFSYSNRLVAPSNDFISGFLAATGFVTTSPDGQENGATSLSDPHRTTLRVTTAAGVGVTIRELARAPGDTTTGCGPGFACFGQISDITVVGAYVGLLEIDLRFDASELPATLAGVLGSFTVFHDGVPLGRCVDTAPVPEKGCLERVQLQDDGDVVALAKSPTNGGWAAGAP